MNTKLILPGCVALTVHAFVLFGLSGKTPHPDLPMPPGFTLPTESMPVDTDDPPPMAPIDREEDPAQGPTATPVPYPPEPPMPSHRADAIPMPPIPPHRGNGDITVIPKSWTPTPAGSGSGSGPVDLKALDRQPRARSQVSPVYPSALRAAGITGTVLVEFLVDKEGNVYNAVAIRSSNPGFIDPALRAVARWKFEPGEVGGKKVRFRMSIPLEFKLDSI